MTIALTGVTCVLESALTDTGHQSIDAVIGMSAGITIKHGRLVGDSVWVSTSMQNAGGAVVTLVGTLASGSLQWDQTPVLWFSLLWPVMMGLSAGAVLLEWMVRMHGATKMSALMLAVPGLPATEAHGCYSESS